MPDQSNQELINIQSTELVFLENELGGLGSRAGAFLLDMVIRYAVITVIMLSFGPGENYSPGYVYFMIMLIMIIYFGYHPFLEFFLAGKTPGKFAAGIRIIKRDGSRMSILDSLIRNILRIVDMLPAAYCTGILVVFFERHNRRFGDIVADTIVVRDRPKFRAFEDFINQQSALTPINRAITIQGIDRLSTSEIAIIKNFYSKMKSMKEAEKIRLSSKIEQKILKKLKFSGTLDTDERLSEVFKRI
jgi:uncharacterized RDD family membrane protein YckC